MDQSFSVEQLVADEPFQEWVLRPTAQNSLFWDAYLTTHPDRADQLGEARQLVLLWHQTQAIDHTTDTPGMVAAIREGVFDRTSVQETDAGVIPLHRPHWRQWWVAAAALVSIALGANWLRQSRQPDWTTLTTAYGQTRQTTLPDGSVVTLNAHSSVRYAATIGQQTVREVWLTGEAFFAVRHLPDHRPFRVHTARMNVDVLGTTFNVADRPTGARVVLVTGKVRVNLTDQPATTTTLKPGQLAEPQPGTTQLQTRTVKPDAYSAWRENRWQLQHEPLADVAVRLEETYGVRVVFNHDADRQRTVTGNVPTGDLNALCDILSQTLGLHVERTGNQLLIYP